MARGLRVETRARRQAARPVDESPGAGGRERPSRGADHQRFPGRPQEHERPGVRAAENEVRPRTSSGDVHFLAQPLRPPAGGRPGGLLSRRSRAGQTGRRIHGADGRKGRRGGRRVAREACPRELADRRGQDDLRREPAQQSRGRRSGHAREGYAAGRAGGSHGAGDDRHAAGGEPRGDPLRLRVPPDDAQLHDVVRRLPGLRPAGAGTGPSGGDGHVRQHLRGRPEPAAAAECRAVPARTDTCWRSRSRRA